jgi:nucleoside-diphosphate-sugar epimerase
MKIMVIGGTGYIGRAVVRRLRAAGHVPVVAVRDPYAAPEEVEGRVVDLTDPVSLRTAITKDIDAVVHAATPTGDWDTDLEAVTALTASLPGRALVYLSGVWVLGSAGHQLDESAPARPIELVSGRPRLEEHVLGAVGVRGVVIRPGIVHGGGGGIPAMMVDWAREAGTGRYVGDPTVRWPMVHVDDLADLVALAVERAEPGTVLHGVAEPAVRVTALAAAADVAAGGAGRSESWPQVEAAVDLGEAFAAALALDQEVVAGAPRALGWTPSGPDALTDLAKGSYRLSEHAL